MGPGILVLGGDFAERGAISAALRQAGFRRLTEASDVSTDVPQGTFDVVVLAGDDVVPACAAARQVPELASLPFLAILPRENVSGVQAVLAAGADEVILAADLRHELGPRVAALLANAAGREAARAAVRSEESLQEILDILAEGQDVTETVRGVLSCVLEVLDFDRASVVLASPDSDMAHVVGATDDATLSKFVVELSAYPEIQEALDTQRVVLIDDATIYPRLGPQHELLVKKRIRSIVVFPMVWRQRPCGVIFLRSPEVGKERLSEPELAYGRIVAKALALYLGGGKLLESVKEQTHRVSVQSFEAERRLRAVERLRDYFDASSDGVVVLDAEGVILFVNRAAEGLTGFARDGLLGHRLADLVSPRDAEVLGDVIARVLAGTNLEPFDLTFRTSGGEPITASVTTSTILTDHDVALLSFREVTAQRKLETELRQTKDFLERLIDSTVDAIVAADIRGNIILFNPGAEHIYGWRAAEVIGRKNVAELYPEGVARQIMRMLRSASYGGVGRLDPTRREIVTRSGQLIPVQMTASIIYEDGQEVATVGIFSDLRERIHIEQRLLAAQEKLHETEKQAMLAELAGAAAHELNQPLTSIMGYAELMKRKLQAGDPFWRAVTTILEETDRMAEIVKKIGRITKYETKDYVGSAQILDLERASEPGFAAAPDEPDGKNRGGAGEKG